MWWIIRYSDDNDVLFIGTKKNDPNISPYFVEHGHRTNHDEVIDMEWNLYCIEEEDVCKVQIFGRNMSQEELDFVKLLPLNTAVLVNINPKLWRNPQNLLGIEDIDYVSFYNKRNFLGENYWCDGYIELERKRPCIVSNDEETIYSLEEIDDWFCHKDILRNISIKY